MRYWILSTLLIFALLLPAKAADAAASPKRASAASRHHARTASSKGKVERKRAETAKADADKSSTKPSQSAPPPCDIDRDKTPPSRSVGHPNDGHLKGGVRLNTTLRSIRVVPVYESGDVRWGLPALVGMIERAAKKVAKRFPGSVLDVGDLSRKGGGEVHRHRSHESGRDADIGFYAVDAKGKQVHAKTFIKFDASLKSINVPGVQFDVARNWQLVQQFLTDPKARVSHIFIAAPLRHALLQEAKRRGVSRALLTRAQLTMMQPTGSLPHDDHIHVRISCPQTMRGECIENAKNAPTWRDRMAKSAKTKKSEKKATKVAAQKQTHKSTRVTRKPRNPQTTDNGSQAARANKPTALSRGVRQDPMDDLDSALMKAPGISQHEAEAESDGIDVRDALDDSGAPKITD